MKPPDTVVASLAGSQLTLAGLIQRLHTQGRLASLVREAVVRQWVLDQARTSGLSVTNEELQQAADIYRQRSGLLSAFDTNAWLTRHGLSLDDFEAGLEETLLARKFRQHLIASKVDAHFAANQAGYESMRVALLVVGREDLAREIASQVREEGRDLDAVALEQQLPVIRRQLLRKELGEPLGAAVAAAKDGDLVGPIASPQGFALAEVKERRPAELDAALRQRIEQELFTDALEYQMNAATLDLSSVGKRG